MAEYARTSPEQKEWLRLCHEAVKGPYISGCDMRAKIERTSGDMMNVRLLDSKTGGLICMARSGHLQTSLDKTKEKWEEFLFPRPG